MIVSGLELVVYSIPSELKKILVLPKKFFNLLVGRRKLDPIYTPDYNR